MDLLFAAEKWAKQQNISFRRIVARADNYSRRIGLRFRFHIRTGNETANFTFTAAVTVLHVEFDDSVVLIETFGQDVDGRETVWRHEGIEVHLSWFGSTNDSLCLGGSARDVRGKHYRCTRSTST